jgi:hypothetical protein
MSHEYHKLSSEIFELTDRINRDYPELYALLDENPLTIGKTESPDELEVLCKNYIESLKELLRHQEETH